MTELASVERLTRQAQLFRDSFGAPRDALEVHAPGRVNLIGEHVDYCDLPVMPIAIQREVSALVAARDDARVRLVNLERDFGPREFELSASIEPAPRGDWSNYVRAAGQMLWQRFGALRGFDAAFSSDLPPAAGLSSSSALVVASALILCRINAIELPRLELAELCADAERYVGTRSGGMDQAICLLGKGGHALEIHFAPLSAEPLLLPGEWSFVIAHSGVLADKSGAARDAYNDRRASCEEALRRVSLHPSLRGTPPRYPDLLAQRSTAELLELGRATLEPAMFPRFRHVVSEAARVREARSALLAGDARAFGAAMDASHASLRDDYSVSCRELDRLVDAAHRHGALGARLTGAGFGGCIVALAAPGGGPVDALLDGLAGVSPLVLVARASDGARWARSDAFA